MKRSSLLSSEDVHPTRRPRRTRMPRSLVDGASWQAKEIGARAVILGGVQQRLVRPADLRDAFGRRGNPRHRRVIDQSIDDAEGGVASIPEREFAQICREYRLPEPERQVVVQRQDGRFYLDAAWGRFDVSAEVHGSPHMELLNWDADLNRQAILAARGLRVLQFSSYAIRHHRANVGMLLAEALRHSGCQG